MPELNPTKEQSHDRYRNVSKGRAQIRLLEHQQHGNCGDGAGLYYV